MTQEERRIFLIEQLLRERSLDANGRMPRDENGQKRLLRSLLNIRMPKPATEVFLQIQDEYLREETKRKGITDFTDLQPVEKGLYLWRGDITTLRCDAIVNAANSRMLGCFCPCHGCVDNAIHTFAGIQLRAACADLMEKKRCEEKIGGAEITPAYNLPCSYVLHTVGPTVIGQVRKKDIGLLASCYRSCLELADKTGLKSVAFCCISTGEFHFPNEKAAEIAVQTVKAYQAHENSRIEVIFNVFKEADYEIYRKLLGAD